jgi:hypothetical protein
MHPVAAVARCWVLRSTMRERRGAPSCHSRDMPKASALEPIPNRSLRSAACVDRGAARRQRQFERMSLHVGSDLKASGE